MREENRISIDSRVHNFWVGWCGGRRGSNDLTVMTDQKSKMTGQNIICPVTMIGQNLYVILSPENL